jgi:sorbitol/mannitol transport system substrate-binding protein
MVGNPQMEDIQKLTADNFTKDTGIKVKFTILPENELRDKVTQDVANQAGQYDVATVGAYEVPIWAKNGWLHELAPRRTRTPATTRPTCSSRWCSRCPARTASCTRLPFYGESSFLMYNKDMFAAKGITMPEHPTWAAGRRHRRQARRQAEQGHEGHLPARPARLGRASRR